MSHTVALLRVVANSHTTWSPQDRERTISGFLEEFTHVLSKEVIDKIAESEPKKLEAMFIDWIRYRNKRTPEQRISLLTASVAKSAPLVTFALADATGDADLAPTTTSNVVEFKLVR